MGLPLLAFLCATASAEEPASWTGGKVVGGLRLDPETGAGTTAAQVEIDARAEVGALSFRLDLDYHIDPVPFGAPIGAERVEPHVATPEAGFLRVGRGRGPDLRLGVTFPEMGLEAVDPDQNPMATYSIGWNLQNGQLLCAEPGWWLGGTVRVFAFAGWDLVWETPGVGGGLSGELGPLSSWSGGFWQPEHRYGMLLSGHELALSDAIRLAFEGDAALAGDAPIFGGQLAVVLDPDPIGVSVRAEHQELDVAAVSDRIGVRLAYRSAFAVAARVVLRDAWVLVAEARQQLRPGGPTFEGTLLLAARTPGEPWSADRAR